MIDPGYYDSGIKKYLMGIGGLDVILLTHGHWDHIYGLDDLKTDFPETPVYIFEDDIDFLTNSHLNCSETNGFRLILQSEAEAITEGELDIGDYHIQVIHTPGHTKGSVTNELLRGHFLKKFRRCPLFALWKKYVIWSCTDDRKM